MSSELEVLKQRITELEAENAEEEGKVVLRKGRVNPGHLTRPDL